MVAVDASAKKLNCFWVVSCLFLLCFSVGFSCVSSFSGKERDSSHPNLPWIARSNPAISPSARSSELGSLVELGRGAPGVRGLQPVAEAVQILTAPGAEGEAPERRAAESPRERRLFQE